MRCFKPISIRCGATLLLALSVLSATVLAATDSRRATFPTKTVQPKPVKKICIMTDLEGVAGVRDWEFWGGPGRTFFDLAQKFLTAEVNAAIQGFAAAGATEFMVIDGHGRGAIDIDQLDPRAQLERGWPSGWPGAALKDGRFDAIAFVGQHAKAGTPFAHMPHTQDTNYLDLAINGVSIGELGQLALCASELGVRTIFASGDEAMTKEAKALLPGIETVAVKRGTTPGTGDDLTQKQYEKRFLSAIHLHPKKSQALIRAGAERAVRRASTESFGLLAPQAPFERVVRFRPKEDGDIITIARDTHPTSVTALMNMKFHPVAEIKATDEKPENPANNEAK